MKVHIIFAFLFCFAHFPANAQSVSAQGKDVSVDSDIIHIYKYDSDWENCDKPIMESWHAHEILEAEGVIVFAIGSGYDGLVYSIEEWGCGSDPTRIHIFSIERKNLEIAQRLGFEYCSDLEDKGGKCHFISYSDLNPENKSRAHVSIYKPSGQTLCQPDSGKSVNDMEEELTSARIVVYQRYSAVDGLSYPLVCGGGTEHINVYVIEKQRLEHSKVMGFRECAWLSMQGGGCFPVNSMMYSKN